MSSSFAVYTQNGQFLERTVYQQRIKFCRFGQDCENEACTFAHDSEELNTLVIKEFEVVDIPVSELIPDGRISPAPTEILMNESSEPDASPQIELSKPEFPAL